MKTLSVLLFFFVFSSTISAQENTNEKRGTIKIQKRGQLVKIQFDNVNYRLIGIDQYGNVLDTAVVEFLMSVSIKGIFYSEKIVGQKVSYQMQQFLGRSDQTSKIFFDKIKAKDKSGNIIDMPKFQYSFGFSDENND